MDIRNAFLRRFDQDPWFVEQYEYEYELHDSAMHVLLGNGTVRF